MRQLGPIGELDTEIQALLVENEVQVSAFAENMLADLPPYPTREQPWHVPEAELARRKDLRGTHRIFSIDPLGSQDIDDALSARSLPDDRMLHFSSVCIPPMCSVSSLSFAGYEVGVHIADVSAFVKENSLLGKRTF